MRRLLSIYDSNLNQINSSPNLNYDFVSPFAEALSSDEDEVDEMSNCYLENVKNFATKKSNDLGLEMSAELKVRMHLKSEKNLILN